MRYALLVIVGYAVFYTWLAFWAPLGADLPPFWPAANGKRRWKIVLIHAFFLVVFLGFSGWFTYREPSIPWFSEAGLRHVGVLYIFIAGLLMVGLERKLLGCGPEPGDFDSDGNENKGSEPDRH
jgi:hypothetical protein